MITVWPVMPDTLTPDELLTELSRRLPWLPPRQLETLTGVFLEIAGGKYVTGKRWSNERRNTAIRDLYNGTNLLHLARRFHLSPRHIRRLAAR